MRSIAWVPMVSLAVAALGASALALADDGAIKLISRGARREALSAMAYKPFDAALWDKLDGWTGPAAPTKESTRAKPVLIVTWANWYKTSHGALAAAQKLADRNPDLFVVGVHHSTGFDKAADTLASVGVKFAVAHDTKGEFFKALQADNSGKLYIVDRAGNLRFADVDKSSLEDAVKIVTDESVEAAAKAEARAKESQKAAGDAPMAGPDVKVRVAPEDYKAVKWPATNKGDLNAKNFQGKPLPAKLGKEKFLGKAPDREGKIVVLDFWATWCPPCRAAMPHLDELAKKYPNDLVVIGISDEKDTVVQGFIKKAKHSYPQAVDEAATVKKALGIAGIPHAVVLSTDGVVRYQGNPYPDADLPAIQEMVAKLMEIDPGVKARHAGEKKAGGG